jgi:hypothetical protein
MSDPVTVTTPGIASVPAATTAPAVTAPAPGFTQDDVNRLLAEDRRKHAEKLKSEAEKIRLQTEETARAAAGQHEQLAAERAARITALEAEQATAQERATALTEAMELHIKTRLKALPEPIRALAPTGDALMRFTWLAQAEEAAQQLAATTPPPTGTPTGPRPTTVAPPAGDTVARMRSDPNYRF